MTRSAIATSIYHGEHPLSRASIRFTGEHPLHGRASASRASIGHHDATISSFHIAPAAQWRYDYPWLLGRYSGSAASTLAERPWSAHGGSRYMPTQSTVPFACRQTGGTDICWTY